MRVPILILIAATMVGCGLEERKAYQQEMEQCRSAGGIVIRSGWDERVMSDCIFPPKEDKKCQP